MTEVKDTEVGDPEFESGAEEGVEADKDVKVDKNVKADKDVKVEEKLNKVVATHSPMSGQWKIISLTTTMSPSTSGV